MQTADFYSSATGTLRVNGGRDENAPAGVSLSIDDLSYIKQGSRANEGGDSFTPTQAQLNAMNSGITSEGVEQISTNKNNISYLTLSGPSKTSDVNNVTRNEFTLYNNSSPNLPTVDYYFVRTSVFSATGALQEAFNTSTGVSYIRTKALGVWSTWLQITNVVNP